MAKMQNGSTKVSQARQVDYDLTEKDIALFRALIGIQNLLGAGMPALTDAKVAQFFGTKWGGSGRFKSLSAAYPNSRNSHVRDWVDAFYASLINVDTCYKEKFPYLFLGYIYGLYFKFLAFAHRFNQLALNLNRAAG